MLDSLKLPGYLSVLTAALCASFGGCAASADGVALPLQTYAVPSADGANAKQLALGKAHGCSLDAAISGVLCWGDSSKGQAKVPALDKPSFIAAGGDTSCAISASGVSCWGDGSQGQSRVPPLAYDATLLAVGAAHVCAAGDRGVICWGDDSKGQLRAPELKDISVLAAGAHHSCALAANGVSCWGDGSQGQLTVPQLTAPSALAVGGDHACVIDSGKVVCWGAGAQAILDNIPSVVEPNVIATGPSHACVLDKNGVQCWGDTAGADLKPRELTMTSQLAVGGGDGQAHACARHLQGVACWGSNNVGQATYNGAPLHIVHASQASIDASSEKVWQIIMDLEKYPEWNPYTIHMESTLQIGDPMKMKVKMSELLTLDQTEYIRVLETGHKVCWGINTDTPAFNSGERCQWLEPLPGGGTLWRNEDLIEGTANELVTSLFGDDVQNGFDAVGVALKKRAESL